MKISAYQPGTVRRGDLDVAYADPVNAELDVLRRAAAAFALRNRRWHEKLPMRPAFKGTASQPVAADEFVAATQEIESWATRTDYDPYFCAGEMMAAYCEVLRRVIKRAPRSESSALGDVLLAAVSFDERLVYELIDDSNADHEFSAAHMRELYRVARARADDGDQDPQLLASLRALEDEE